MASGVEIFTGLKSPIGLIYVGRQPSKCKASTRLPWQTRPIVSKGSQRAASRTG